MTSPTRNLLRSEDGFSVPITVILLSIILLVAGVASVAAVASLSDTRRDRSSTRAFEAADSGVDIVQWHMNRQAVSNEVATLLGYTGVVQTDACLEYDVDAEAVVLDIDGSAGGNGQFCAVLELPDLPDLPIGGTVECATQVPLGLDLTGDLEGTVNNIVTRQIVCTGQDGDTTRRILVRLGLEIDPGGGNPLEDALWQRYGWVECTSEAPSQSDPASGCPSLPPIA